MTRGNAGRGDQGACGKTRKPKGWRGDSKGHRKAALKGAKKRKIKYKGDPVRWIAENKKGAERGAKEIRKRGNKAKIVKSEFKSVTGGYMYYVDMYPY